MKSPDFKEYLKTIDEIRLAKNLTVEELCEGIISERTYYRYLHTETQINYKVIDKLALKLNIEVHELIYYSYFIKHSDPGFTRFIYRVHIHYFDDIIRIYDSVIEHEVDNERFELVLKCYIDKYRSITGEITPSEYKHTMETSVNRLDAFKSHCINTTLLKSLYLYEHNEIDQRFLKEITDYLTNNLINAEILFATMALDNTLYALMRSKKPDIKTFINLKDIMEEILENFPHRYFQNRFSLYDAFLHHYQGNKKEVQNILYKYLLGIIIMDKGDRYNKQIEFVQSIFNVNPESYLSSTLESLLKGHSDFSKNNIE